LLFVHIGWHIWIMGLPTPKLLVVEDDPKTARSLVAGLQAQGFSAYAAQRGDDALDGAALMAIARIFFFKEPASALRLLGIVLALAGLTLLRSPATS
jgi:DNA-binding response OmpR family regulator